MKKSLLIFLGSIWMLFCTAQQQDILRLKQQLKEHTAADTFRVNRLVEYSHLVSSSTPLYDSVINEVVALSQKLNYPEGKAYGLIGRSNAQIRAGKITEALSLKQQALNIAETLPNKTCLVYAYLSIGNLKVNSGNSKKGLADFLKAEPIAEATHDKVLLANCQRVISSTYQNSFGDVAKAMEWSLQSLKNAEEAKSLSGMAQTWTNMAGIYTAMGDSKKALAYYQKALAANKQLGNYNLQFTLLNRIGEMYRLQGNYSQAIDAYKKGLTKTTIPYNIELTQSNMADVYVRTGELPLAFKYAFMSLKRAETLGDADGEEWIEGILARAYLKINKTDSALYYANKGYYNALKTSNLEFKRDNTEALANAYYLKKDFPNAYKFYKLFINYRDSMSGAEFTNRANVMAFNYDLAKKQAQITVLNQDKRAQKDFLISAAVLIALTIIAVIILFTINRQKQRANILLDKQKHIIEEQRDETNRALADLQRMQSQLVQSEKMASLGELTAGIAHEIQNLLNFINNFSDVNKELIDEMADELKLGNVDDALGIAADISQNEEKINYHGKRADSIVKGMLQHSRASSTVKEPANINSLTDEYLRLAYHGLRARDKSFNADLLTDFDSLLPEIKIVPQDIGRVLLNLFNNAFYAVQQRLKEDTAFSPAIKVGTSFLQTPYGTNYVVIRVRDNGIGIPENIKDKILQPFFTTKPTGEGTGLGLSLSYDIVVKAHSGEIDINSKPGEYTEFIISLPV